MHKFILIILNFLLLQNSCTKEIKYSELTLKANSGDIYEIYRVDDQTKNFKSKNFGLYNKAIKLESGTYIILTQCSHKKIKLTPGEKKTIALKQVIFNPPNQSSVSANFLVQCEAHPELTGLRSYEKIFTFNLFSLKKELKINQKKLFLDPGKKIKKQTILIQLASLKLKLPNKLKTSHYFITEKNNESGSTQSESLGSERLLLAGKYEIILSGSKKKINLKPGDTLSLKTASIKIKKPKNFDEKRTLKHQGRVYKIFLNKNFRVFLDERVPVFSGSHFIRFEDSKETLAFNIEEESYKTFKPKSVYIESNCSKERPNCYGEKDIFFYSKERDLIYQGKSDVPFLYFKKPLGIGFISSQGLIYWLSENETSAKMARLTLIPEEKTKDGNISEFARLEPGNMKISGFSRDIKFNKSTHFDLIEGQYKIVIYQKMNKDKKKKEKTTLSVSILGQKSIKKKFPFFTKKVPPIKESA